MAGSDIVIVTSSDVAVQVPFVIVQRNTVVVPGVKSVMAVVGEVSAPIVQVPLTMLQLPVPTPAALDDIAVAVALHNSWSGPASAIVPDWSIVIITSSLVDTQLPLLIVQRNLTAVPAVNPVIVVAGLDGAVIVAIPACKVHRPAPITAGLPANVAVTVLQSS